MTIRIRRRWALLGVLGVLAGAAAGPPVAAQAAAPSFISFGEFLADTAQARYATALVEGTTGKVRSAQAFDEMRSYVLRTYQGVKADHSYLADGSYFDCVSTMSQPTVRALGITRLAAPPAADPVASGKAADAGVLRAASPLTLGLRDAFGNTISCAAGTIPMQRITLERLTRFGTVREFLAKGPNGAGEIGTQAATRQYAYGRQYVSNHGGNSVLNLWNPSANFSISQQWYGTGSGASTQTAEGGWIKYPAKFGNSSVTFIYFTPDNYSTGCYNLDCAGFVQTNSNWALGGAWSAYSALGGTQYFFTMQWKWFQGNWWLYLQGSGAMEAVGYYPGSVYNGGAMATAATRASYGGEVAPNGSTWPPMGSGQFASAGFGWAAYQRNIFYINTSDASVWTSLTTTQTAPACYTIAYTPSSSGGSWGTYFYFGGPGGTC